MASDIKYVRHINVENFAFRSPVGMVGRWTTQKAREVSVVAIALAPKPGQGEGYATGELAKDILPEKATVTRSGPEARVISDTDYAYFVHEGTRPHRIKARPKKKLAFFSRNRGQVIFTDDVKHPGTPANRYLLEALKKVFGGPGR